MNVNITVLEQSDNYQIVLFEYIGSNNPILIHSTIYDYCSTQEYSQYINAPTNHQQFRMLELIK